MIRLRNLWAIALILMVFYSCEKDVETENYLATNNDGSLKATTDDESWDESTEVTITLSGSSITSTSSSVTIEESIATITEAGNYYISGSLTDGQIYVNSKEDGIVRLILGGVNISCSDNAPVYIKNAEKAMIYLASGSTNTISDGSTYSSDEEDANAAIFSKEDLTIFGDGSLTVYANYADGITSKDGLTITNGTINVTSVDDGIRGKDYLYIEYGDITINADGDGFKSDNEDDSTVGYITIEDGSFDISSDADGIQAESDLNINGGTISINATDDAINATNSVNVNGGDLTISAGDDGIHAENEVILEDATITINSAVEGIEGGYITVNSGTIIVNATDDGFNATQGTGSMNSDGSQLIVNGGTITVNMSGNDVDAMDSNGDAYINAGTLYLNYPTGGMNEAIDVNGTCTINSAATVYANGEIYTGEENTGDFNDGPTDGSNDGPGSNTGGSTRPGMSGGRGF